MSKKLAEGIDALVLDVKTGRGAFMQTYDRSVELANALVAIGNSFGKETVAYITDMNQPLGTAIGNWLEVVETIECLRGNEVADVMELTYVLGGAMVMLGKKASSVKEGIERCKEVVRNGKAYEKFLQLVRRQGGDAAFVEHPEKYPRSKYSEEIKTSKGGYVISIDPLELGFTGITLGAGRTRIDDVIDPKAGIILRKKVGDLVGPGDVLAVLHTDNNNAVEGAAKRTMDAFVIGPAKPQQLPLVISYVDKTGVKPFNRS
jgi:pyrimidine-nucleoside phosphorylase